MRILKDYRYFFDKEIFIRFFQTRRNYFSVITIIFILCGIFLFFCNNHHKNLLLEDASKYHYAINANNKNKIFIFEKLKNSHTVYGQLAKLQLAEFYSEINDYNKCIRNYKLAINNKKHLSLHSDYARLMLIREKISLGISKNENMIKVYEQSGNTSIYFKNIYILGRSVLSINGCKKNCVLATLNEILTDSESSNMLIYFIRVIIGKTL